MVPPYIVKTWPVSWCAEVALPEPFASATTVPSSGIGNVLVGGLLEGGETQSEAFMFAQRSALVCV